MADTPVSSPPLSAWWRHTSVLVLVFGLSVLIYLTTRTYRDAPPIPGRVVDPAGRTVFTGETVRDGQEVFLRYGLMENGSVWGHGAYLGPDFSAAYLHRLLDDAAEAFSVARYNRHFAALDAPERQSVETGVQLLLRQNRYDARTGILTFTDAEVHSYEKQVHVYAEYFSQPVTSAGLTARYIENADDLRRLTAFFAWTAWASIAPRPGTGHSYTNNFPYEPRVGNTVTSEAVLWSALSLITLLAGTGLVLLAFGRFDYLGWKSQRSHVHPQLIPGVTSGSQRATIKYFLLAAVLFLVQALVGGATAHYRADPGSFYGLDLARWLPSNIVRTWHVQLAIFWIATAYVAGGLLLAPAVAGSERRGQTLGTHVLFAALVLVVFGSLLGEWLGIRQWLGPLWFWLGHQGWEYLDLGRFWQVLLAVALSGWIVLLFRGLGPARQDPQSGEVASLFLYAAVALPIFYVPALFFTARSHFSVVDTWRFWIIHLWVEGFFEVFVTAMVAIIFFKLGVIAARTATRVVYLDAILYLGSGMVGTAHHWYWTGQSSAAIALGAMFSAMEVVPLTLLTLDAWDFTKLTRGTCDVCGQGIAVPHRWTFYFLMAVGFWNFVGAGVFGFLINLPVISYFEVGTLLTPNHGHAAMMGTFGMLALALMVLALRQVSSEAEWAGVEKYVRVSFWGLNIGLALMVLTSLFPGGVLQLMDVLNHGYWHARSREFLDQPFIRTLEWLRLPGDVIFIAFGVVPLVCVAVRTYWRLTWSGPADTVPLHV